MNKAVRPNQSGFKILYMLPNNGLRCLGTSSVVVEHTDSEWYWFAWHRRRQRAFADSQSSVQLHCGLGRLHMKSENRHLKDANWSHRTQLPFLVLQLHPRCATECQRVPWLSDCVCLYLANMRSLMDEETAEDIKGHDYPCAWPFICSLPRSSLAQLTQQFPSTPVHSAASSSANSFLFDSQRTICFTFFEWWCFWILWRRCVGFAGDLKGKGKGKIKGKLQEVLEGQMQIDSFILVDPEGYGCFQPAPMYHQWIQVWSLEQTCASICTVWTRTCLILVQFVYFGQDSPSTSVHAVSIDPCKSTLKFPFCHWLRIETTEGMNLNNLCRGRLNKHLRRQIALYI